MTVNRFVLYPVKIKLHTTNDFSFIVEFCAGPKEGQEDAGSASFALSYSTALDLANAIIKIASKGGKVFKRGNTLKITVH